MFNFVVFDENSCSDIHCVYEKSGLETLTQTTYTKV